MSLDYATKDAMRPESLDSFTGQPDLSRKLDMLLSSARDRGQLPDHTLFAGPPGLGKTTLAHIIAAELSLPITTVTGPSLEKPADVIPLLHGRSAPGVVFIDEIHRMGAAAEETLYPAMEDGSIPIRIGEGRDAEHVTIPVAPFVVVGATTQVGLLSAPLRDRFGFHGRLQPYSPESLAQIIMTNADKMDTPLLESAAGTIASRSRGTPRVANQLLSRVRDYGRFEKLTSISAEDAARALDLFGIDSLGLDEVGRSLLQVLCGQFNGGPVGLSSLASSVGETTGTLETVYEPHLMSTGLIRRLPQGRIATCKGFEHVGLTAPDGWEH